MYSKNEHKEFGKILDNVILDIRSIANRYEVYENDPSSISDENVIEWISILEDITKRCKKLHKNKIGKNDPILKNTIFKIKSYAKELLKFFRRKLKDDN